jgi:transposase
MQKQILKLRVIKNVIELRPMYHRKDDRVEGHVFICILAFLVNRLLEQKTGKTIKTIWEEYATSVALPGKKQPLILGSRDLLQAIQ